MGLGEPVKGRREWGYLLRGAGCAQWQVSVIRQLHGRQRAKDESTQADDDNESKRD